MRWDEERAKLKALVIMYRQKATYNSDMASRLQAAVTRLDRFEREGPPEALPLPQNLRMKLDGGRTAKRAIIAEQVELTGLMQPFDLEIWFGERVAVLGSNGSGKSHFLRLLAAGGSRPDLEHEPVGDVVPPPVAHTGMAQARLTRATGLVRADPRAPVIDGAHAARDLAPRRRAPKGHGARGIGQGAGPLRPRQGR